MIAEPSAAPHQDLVAWLVERGLVEAADVVLGDLVLRDRSRRNANVLVERRRAESHFVKMASGPHGAGALSREAERYRALADAGLSSIAPAARLYDPGRGLVLEGMPAARDLRAFHLRAGAFPAAVGAEVGDVLAALHSATAPAWRERPATDSPWVLAIHRPTVDGLRTLTAPTLDLVRAVQGEPGIGRRLDDLRDGWRATALVHNDLKWDNVLILDGPDGDGASVRLVDWEHADGGDPLWDVGAAIAGYLSFWVFSLDARARVPPAQLAGRTRFPLGSMAPALRALWSAYLARRGDGDEHGDLLARAVRMAAARLLVIAYEATQTAVDLNAHLVLHVQLAANLLERPGDGCVQLGFGPAAGVAA